MIKPVKRGQPEYCLFVIDTDIYAGSFEREMCAYVTGQIGECGVGRENAKLARQEIPDAIAQLENLVELVPDEHGCARPVSIFPNPKYGNDGHGNQALLTDKNREQFQWPAYNSVAIFFHSIPDSSLLDVMEERARSIAAKGVGLKGYETPVKIEGFRFLEQYVIYKKIRRIQK